MTVPPHQPYDPSQRQPGSPPPSPGQPSYGPPAGYSSTGMSSGVVNLLGGIVGVVGTILALGIALTGAFKTAESQVVQAGADAAGMMLVLLGVVILAGIVFSAYWAPLTPLVPGVLLIFLGFVGMIWRDFLVELYELLPESGAANMFFTWLQFGAILCTGVLMTSAGALAWFSQQRRVSRA